MGGSGFAFAVGVGVGFVATLVLQLGPEMETMPWPGFRKACPPMRVRSTPATPAPQEPSHAAPTVPSSSPEQYPSESSLYTVHPIARGLPPAPSLSKNYGCLYVVADSISWSKMRKGIYGYQHFAHAILKEAGYNGSLIVDGRPGIGLVDWVKDGMLSGMKKRIEAEGCGAVAVQLGINDAFKNLSPEAFLALYRGVVADLRRAVLPGATVLALVNVMPTTYFGEPGTGEWLHAVNVGLAEIAAAHQAVLVDAHWAVLNAYRAMSFPKSWIGVLDDHVHPTSSTRYVIGRQLAASLLAGAGGCYRVAFTCGEAVHFMGYVIRPSWPKGASPWACHKNPRVRLCLGNATLAFDQLPVELSLTPPFATKYTRMPVVGSYAAVVDGRETPFDAPVGGAANWFKIPAGSREFSIRLVRERSFRGGKPQARPPQPMRDSHPGNDLADALKTEL
ncbi:hypothetical protein DIPPA_32526 [Diplonema papillatum]|nr:hypothetical protein DIPPA_32526 [Diplonema papillatum]